VDPSIDYVHVAFTSDENTLIGTVAAVNSIWKNAKHPVMFLLVTNDEAYPLLKSWIENSELRDMTYVLKKFDASVLDGKIVVRGGRQELAKPMNYARYYYPTLFPDVHGRVVHVDDDCIVQGDIYELANTPIAEGHICSFSEDCSSVAKRFSLFQNTYSNYLNFKHPAIKERNILPSACAFNAGMYVTDLDRWRQGNLTAELEYWIELNTRENVYGNQQGGGGSQPPMMIALYGKFSVMDPLWHVRHLGWTAGARYSRAFIQSAKLLHWNGSFKPWNGVSSFGDIWEKYYVPDPSGRYVPVRKH
ncbi:hypothetical protein CAPTEDRAFT_44527, partial [Capitella teleta]